MIKKNFKHRWIYLFVGILGLFYAGCINAFSTLMVPIGEEFPSWTKAQFSTVFTLLQSTFCIVGMVGGFTSNRINSKWTIRFASVMYLCGFLFASFTHSYFGFCILFGVLSGAGMGLIYNAVVRTVVRWFPDRAGISSGLLLMGYGMAGFLIGKLFQGLTPEFVGAWRSSFRVIGISSVVVLYIVSLFILEPSRSDLPETMRSSGAASRPDEFIGNYSPGQVLKNKGFILFYLYGILLSIIGSTVLTHASGIAMETAPLMSAAKIATIVGMMPFANGIGRIVFGILTDKIRVRKSTFLSCTIFLTSAVFLLLALLMNNTVLLVAGFLTCGFSFGSLGTINSAYAATRFGFDHYAINFAFMNTAGIFASALVIPVGALFDMTRTYVYPVIVLISAGAVAYFFRIFLFRYERKLHEKE